MLKDSSVQASLPPAIFKLVDSLGELWRGWHLAWLRHAYSEQAEIDVGSVSLLDVSLFLI